MNWWFWKRFFMNMSIFRNQYSFVFNAMAIVATFTKHCTTKWIAEGQSFDLRSQRKQVLGRETFSVLKLGITECWRIFTRRFLVISTNTSSPTTNFFGIKLCLPWSRGKNLLTRIRVEFSNFRYQSRGSRDKDAFVISLRHSVYLT